MKGACIGALCACFFAVSFTQGQSIAPTITVQPKALTVAAGEDAVFSVTVTNTATLPISYEWRKFPSTSLTNILVNARSSSFTLYNVQADLAETTGPGNYGVTVSNAATAPSRIASFSARLTVVPATIPLDATTGAATEIAGNGATLNGSVNPNRSMTSVWFDYGLTSDYGTSTAAIPAGNGTNVVALSIGATGLIPGTLYHYRLAARDKSGLAAGNDKTFTTADTSVPPPSSATLPPSNVTIATAVMNGSVDPRGGYVLAYFEYGATTNYGRITEMTNVTHGSDLVPVGQTVTGLSAGTTYHYRILASASAGTSFGVDQSFQTLPPPEVVTLRGPLVTSTAVILAGTVNPRR